MQTEMASPIAFGKPGGEAVVPSRGRPIDLVHLARQTMGDRGLEQEVLSLFLHQLRGIERQMGAADKAERVRLAHGLKGSARGVGAFAVAECAGMIEEDPSGDVLVAQLRALVAEAQEFIAAISR